MPTTDDVTKSMCDLVVSRAVAMMQETGAPVGMILDRLLTYSAAQACLIDGSATTATNFRIFADKIEGGLFHTVTGERGQRH